MTNRQRRAVVGVGLAVLVATAVSVGVGGQTPGAGATGYLTGVVQGASGPKAGVWVIAETKDLPTNLIKIVVTDDRGRFMVPELPAASYNVWARGYGLADSTPQPLRPGPATVTLRVNPAKTPQEAAKVYPGDYWLSMLEPQWVTLRVPYPLGFYSRGLDGRIDDPNAGWKGRGLYANYGTHFVWHIEGGKGTKGKLVKFQLRPDPLAR